MANLLDILLLAFGLAMDCFAVSVSQSQTSKTFRTATFIFMAILFGLFQGGMPLISFYLGNYFSAWVENYVHWLALIILAFLGAKMIYESRETKELNDSKHLTIAKILLLAVATSIDALSIGVLFVPSPHMLWIGVAVICIVTFFMSVLGCILGYYLGKRFSFNAELWGGIILIIIGLKIFITHYIG
ncbi:MAG: manganese efflux pump [Paludibacteraceae bacterium]|nr:manganese efflux pump [Paludibacteraceae bacterium]